MKISVIIPTHNRLSQLHQAFESVCNQTKKPDEIIIVDDASDNQNNIDIQDFFYKDIIIKIEKFESSKGACFARNRGVEIASGDIIMFLDDDDTWEPQKIESQLNVFNDNSQIGLVYSGRLIVSTYNRKEVIYEIHPHAYGNLYPPILYSNLIGTTSSVAIKKSLFKEVGGFDEELPALQDYDLWIRCCKKSIVGHDNACNVRYTVYENPNLQISGQSYRHIEAVTRILDKYQEEIVSQGFLKARQIKSSKLFSVAKSVRNSSLKKAAPWICASFIQYPNMKVLGLILPVKMLFFLRKVKSKLLQVFN
jgi:glycosyltransferase involved in cell wall biosynthesis